MEPGFKKGAGVTRTEEFEEPLPGNPHQDPEPADSSLTAALLLLERLSPLERAVLVLREVFGCSVCEIASAVGCSQATCHQLIAASTTAGDGDGESEAVPWPQRIAGAENVARLITAIVAPLLRVGVTLEEHLVSGRPGSLFRDRNGKILSAMAFDFTEGRIQEIHLVINPDAFGHADRTAETHAVNREANRAH